MNKTLLLQKINYYLSTLKANGKVFGATCKIETDAKIGEHIIVEIQPTLLINWVYIGYNFEGNCILFVGNSEYTLYSTHEIRNTVSDLIKEYNKDDDEVKCKHLNMSEECRANNNELCENINDCYFKQLQKTDAMLSKLNEELLKIVNPRMSDFTGYNEETNSFDIVLAVKEIIEDLEDTIESKEAAIERLLNDEDI